MTQRHLRVGFVAGVHGIRGALRLRSYDPGSDAIARAHALWLHRDDAAIGRYEIEHAASVPGRTGELRVTLVGVEDRTRAEALVGAEVAIDRAELPPLLDDEYYLADVLGATVERVGDGAVLGKVVDVTSNGMQDLLEIESHDASAVAHRWLLPALPQFVKEVKSDRIRVDVPPGFLPDALEPEP